MNDDNELCPICGLDRDSEDCCGWCLSCQDDIADWDGTFCQICIANSEPGDGDYEPYYPGYELDES
jgi:hypothetical protein